MVVRSLYLELHPPQHDRLPWAQKISQDQDHELLTATNPLPDRQYWE